jgi:ABC-type multidrug transport system fused ATPase/permease subunit
VFLLFSQQDEVSQEAVQQALATLIAESNATVVLVAHRLSTVVNADSICVIDKGAVLEQGNHEELVSMGGIYACMVEKQLKKKADLIEQDGDEAHKKKVAADDIDALLAEK